MLCECGVFPGAILATTRSVKALAQAVEVAWRVYIVGEMVYCRGETVVSLRGMCAIRRPLIGLID